MRSRSELRKTERQPEREFTSGRRGMRRGHPRGAARTEDPYRLDQRPPGSPAGLVHRTDVTPVIGHGAFPLSATSVGPPT